ncbi:MAG: hypothetical protein NDI66_08660, partial [Pseudomonas sp.]|nr:hypothetical protein [Pseudomonas sp.]
MPCFRNDRVLAGDAQVRCFTRPAYPRTEGGHLPGVALQDRGPFGPGTQDADPFTVTMAPFAATT